LVLALSVYAFLTTRVLEASEAKLISERLLFVGILVSLLLLGVGLYAVLRAFRLSNALDKIVEMNRLTGFNADTALTRLGEVGEKIALLYAQVNELSERKSVKISAQAALNDFLLSLSEDAVLVTDARGTVIHMSRKVLERLEASRAGLIGSSLDELLPDAEIGSAIAEMSRSRAPVTREQRGESIVLTPIFNREGSVAYAVVGFSRAIGELMRERLSASRAKTSERRPPEASEHRPGLLRRIFGRSGKS
jgi:signal transduction histidine kinase